MKGEINVMTMVGLMIVVLIGVVAVLPITQNTVRQASSDALVTGETHADASSVVQWNGTAASTNKTFSLGRTAIPQTLTISNTTVNYTRLSGICNFEISSFQVVQISPTTPTQITLCRHNTTDTVTAQYQYYPSSYVNDSASRTMLNIIPLFIGIAVLLFVVSMLYLKYR